MNQNKEELALLNVIWFGKFIGKFAKDKMSILQLELSPTNMMTILSMKKKTSEKQNLELKRTRDSFGLVMKRIGNGKWHQYGFIRKDILLKFATNNKNSQI